MRRQEPHPRTVEIGARIRLARRDAGLTQKELARRLSVSPRSITEYENGRTSAYLRLDNLAQVLGATKEWLLHGDAAQEQHPLDRRLFVIEAQLGDLDEQLEEIHGVVREILRKVS